MGGLAVLPTTLAVVRGQDDQRVVQDPEPLELVQELADVVVGEANLRVVEGAQMAPIARGPGLRRLGVVMSSQMTRNYLYTKELRYW